MPNDTWHYYPKTDSLAYTSKGCTPVEVLPVPNGYTTCEHQLVFLNHKVSNNFVILVDIFYVLLQSVVYARIRDRKYLNRGTPF